MRKRWKTFPRPRGCVVRKSPASCETRSSQDTSIPAKYYSIGSRNFLLYPGRVAESSVGSRVYFEMLENSKRNDDEEETIPKAK